MAISYPTLPGRRLKDHSGSRFNSWTILRYSHSNKRVHYWWARCKCGTENMVIIQHVISGRSTQCKACAARIDGRTGTPEYKIYNEMKSRCQNAKHCSYHNYGGRLIAVCQRWLDDFANFLSDMGPRPSTKHSIERIDNDGDYCPENCCWATPKEQHRNKRTNHKLEFQGRTMCISEWAEELDIPTAVLFGRLRHNWPTRMALTTPVITRNGPVTFQGTTQSVAAWAKQIGMSTRTLHNRLTRLSWSVKRALTTPAAKRKP